MASVPPALPPMNPSRLKIDFSGKRNNDINISPELAHIYSKSSGKLKFTPDSIYDFTSADLLDQGEIGRGNFGAVNKMLHVQSGNVLAVKRIRSNMVDQTEQKRLLVELEAIMNSSFDSIVQFYGAIFHEGDCWICMEMMNLCLERLYKIVYEKQNRILPENIIGCVAVSTVSALDYLKESLKIIHRDVKPSNILLNRNGYVKLCDFGIAGHLIDSLAKSHDAACQAYIAPERLQSTEPYDVRSDVWSLGITLFEISTGKFPYRAWDSPFQQLQEVVIGEPPVMPSGCYSSHLLDFVNSCLIKAKEARPKYKDLKSMEFFKTYCAQNEEDCLQSRITVGMFVTEALIFDSLLTTDSLCGNNVCA